tara:strand:- start:254 stop:454 length:201 start_codon:yes stop_codon:yes gene_type:complete
MDNMPMYYNQTRNQLLLIYLRKQILVKGLENKQENNIEWVKTATKEKKKKKINLKKIKYTIRNILG